MAHAKNRCKRQREPILSFKNQKNQQKETLLNSTKVSREIFCRTLSPHSHKPTTKLASFRITTHHQSYQAKSNNISSMTLSLSPSGHQVGGDGSDSKDNNIHQSKFFRSTAPMSFFFHTLTNSSSRKQTCVYAPSFPSLNSFNFLLATTLSILFLSSVSLTSGESSFEDFLTSPGDVLKNMVRTFGRELSSAGTEQTCLGRIEENYQAYAGEVAYFDGNKMMDDMRQDVINMLNWKRHAVDRIANESERISSNHTFDRNLDHFPFINVNPPSAAEMEAAAVSSGSDGGIGSEPENLRPTAGTYNNFDSTEVDLESSAVHVPVNVYHKSVEVLNDIKWSDALTPFFKNNLAFDPSLSWQFFGSAKGFLRLYPAFRWQEPPSFSIKDDVTPVDFYDCRLRNWYIAGAASPKDVVILLDSSGSMLGSRRILGKDVVSKILDTLTDNDYVAALQFNKNVTPICGCLDRLVPATRRNILTIKGALADVRAEHPVNFTGALIEAFRVLQSVNRAGGGSQCNQAIMIVTDGAPATYEDIFRQFNWPNIPVRVFTYLVGKDVTPMEENVYWMACSNRGYFAHVANLAEVHEQVQKYIPVLSRPVVLSGERIFSWTPVYAPNSKVELAPWNWEDKQRSDIVAHLRAMSARVADEEVVSDSESNSNSEAGEENRHHDRRNTIDWAHRTSLNSPTTSDKTPTSGNNVEADAATSAKEKEAHSEPYISADSASASAKREASKCDVTLYTTLSTSVFDTRNYTNITRRILIKNVYQDTEPEQIRIANLLGVAGIDVPIKEITKLTPPFKLGVNAYVFIISNNGYILYHPDLRPCFEDFLKPFYNSVDLSEVELANKSRPARDWDPEIEAIRHNMIERTHGWKKVAVKVHSEGMRRVATRVHHYTHGSISNTPFSLAIALPEPYGSYRLTSHIDLKMKFRSENFTAYFAGDQWRVHPEWPYCTSPQRPFGSGGDALGTMTPEAVITKFLSVELESNNFRWRTSSIRPQVYDTISCDKDLVQKLVLDAKLTDIPSTKCNTSPNLRDDQRIKTFGIASTFVATRSGLTRFQDYRSAEEIRAASASSGEEPFYEEHKKAIEETYYQRAVDFYATNNRDAFVYAVDFDAGTAFAGRHASATSFLVTATHALFIGNGKQSTPVAVVGIQFRYGVLHEFFLNTTNKFNVPCTHLDMDCYLVDNNGFVVVSNHRVEDVGRFFGLVDGDILEDLVSVGVFRRVHMFDYQAICVKLVGGPGGGTYAPSARPYAFSLLSAAYSVFSAFLHTLAALYVDVIYGRGLSALGAIFECDSDPLSQQQNQEPLPSAQVGGKSATDPFSGFNMTTAEPCDKEFDLFEMMDFSNVTRTQEVACGQSPGCSRKYLAQYVPHTNLFMVMVDNNPNCQCRKKQVDIEPQEVQYSQAEMCAQLRTEKSRKRPTACHNYHPQEKDIRQCGGSSTAHSPNFFVVVLLLFSCIIFFDDNHRHLMSLRVFH